MRFGTRAYGGDWLRGPTVGLGVDVARPLKGVRVLALEQAISSPLCTRHLADLGARVIKVEHPRGGDSTRHYDQVVHGSGAHFVWLNAGKESIALDLTLGSDRDVLEQLIEETDVFISNLAPGALLRLGLSTDSLAARFPALIVVDISGYGQGGPLSERKAYDLLIQSESGSCRMTGWPGSPAKPGIPITDIGTALYALSAILTALFVRERTGAGAVIPIAMFDVAAEMMGFALNQFIHTGIEPQPVGMGSPMVAPYAAYDTMDGHVVVLGTTSDREWRILAEEVMERPDLASNPGFSSNSDRLARREDLDGLIQEWCALHTLQDIQRRADAAGIGQARLNGVGDLADHEQLRSRDRWMTVMTPGGAAPALRPPALSDAWSFVPGAVPGLGEHSEAIRAELAKRAGP